MLRDVSLNLQRQLLAERAISQCAEWDNIPVDPYSHQ